MSESFITPRSKKILSVELTWLLSLFLVLVVVMAVSALFLDRAVTAERMTLSETNKEIAVLKDREERVSSEITRLEVLEKMRERISTQNRLKKENVKNFFDLVPEDVVLELAELREGTLRLQGITKSPKHFKQQFQRSLDSLFVQSSTRFKALKNGSYHFSSIAYSGEKK